MLLSFMKYLNLNTIDEVPIYTDETQIPNGYGLNINGFILTASHVVQNVNFIKIKNKSYIIDIIIDEYDIAILKEPDKNINYNVFLNDLNKYINNNNKISNIDNLQNKYCYIRDLKINYEDIECDYIKTNIFPPLPVFIFSSDTSINYSGYSGSPVLYKNNVYGLLISQDINTNKIKVLPLEIIYYILKNYIMNFMIFHYMPINIKENVITNNFRNLIKDDIIYKINDILIENNMIYDDRIQNLIPIDTYLILNGFKNIKVEYYRNTKTKKKLHTINIQLKIFNYKNISLNFRDTKKYKEIKDVIFSELSEEYILELYQKNIKIINNIYDNLYLNSKIIFLKNINNQLIKEKLEKNNINFNNELYILNKISGRKINNLDDLERYKDFKNITIEIIDSKMNNIKIKI